MHEAMTSLCLTDISAATNSERIDWQSAHMAELFSPRFCAEPPVACLEWSGPRPRTISSGKTATVEGRGECSLRTVRRRMTDEEADCRRDGRRVSRRLECPGFRGDRDDHGESGRSGVLHERQGEQHRRRPQDAERYAGVRDGVCEGGASPRASNE